MFAAKFARSFNASPRRSYSVGQNILNAPGTLRDVNGNTVKASEFFKGKKVAGCTEVKIISDSLIGDCPRCAWRFYSRLLN